MKKGDRVSLLIPPSADLVAWSRLGSAYRPADLTRAVEQDRTLFEHSAFLRPVEDLPLYLAGAADRPRAASARAWLAANDRFRRDVLERLAASGPLPSREIPDTSVVPWPSSGWTNHSNVTQMLEILGMSDRIGVMRAGRLTRILPANAAAEDVMTEALGNT